MEITFKVTRDDDNGFNLVINDTRQFYFDNVDKVKEKIAEIILIEMESEPD